MRGGGGVLAARELLLELVVVLALVAGSGTLNNLCHMRDTKRVVRIGGEAQCVTVTWASDAERAAAALFTGALRHAGYSCVTLAHAHDTTQHSNSVVLSLGRAFHESGSYAAPGAVPVAALLHVRLATTYNNRTDCLQAIKPTFYNNHQHYQYCGFNVTKRNKAIVYILEEWTDVGKELEARVLENGLQLELVWNIKRSDLHSNIYRGDKSFLFVDVDLWSDVGEVLQVNPPPCSLVTSNCLQVLHPIVSVRFASNEKHLKFYAPGLYNFFESFTVELNTIREVLEYESSHNSSQAVFNWASKNRNRFCKWVKKAQIQRPYFAVVFVCIEDPNRYEYKWIIKNISKTRPLKNIRLYLNNVTCSDEADLRSKLVNILFFDDYMSFVGAIVAGEGVITAASCLAEQLEVPLLAYDDTGGRKAGAIGGNGSLVALALCRFIEFCQWRRIVIISEASTLAFAVKDEIRKRIPLNLVLKEEDVPDSHEDLKNLLMKLIEDDARIFIVNAGMRTSVTILGIAEKQGWSPSNGRIWLLRETVKMPEYNMEYYSISTNLPHVDIIDELPHKELVKSMSERWKNRIWPQYAASLANALLTLGEGFHRLTRTTPELLDDIHARGTVSSFWNHLENEAVPGLTHMIKYTNRTAKIPFVFVEVWNASGRFVVKKWNTSDLERDSFEDKCPISNEYSDGATQCLTPTGDPFVPGCNDALWASIAISLFLTFISLSTAIFMTQKKIKHSPVPQHTFMWNKTQPPLPLIERSLLEMREELGEGRFGRVWLGLLREPGRPPRAVAAKALRQNAQLAEESEFVREARMLAQLDHEHIVKFVGVCDKGGPPLLLMEHAFFGDLLRYLKARRHLAEGLTVDEQNIKVREDAEEAAHVSAIALTRLAREAADALAYLARCGIVHCDLRAANCLVDAKRTLKLGDFGMARITSGPAGDGEYACRRRDFFPVLWMPPESLKRGVFTSSSDIWALGVLFLELVTLGRRPFGSRPPIHVLQTVVNGGRAPLPLDASEETRMLTMACWRREPTARPDADAIVAWLREHPRALRPALLDADEDTESGFGEPLTPRMDGGYSTAIFEQSTPPA